MKNGPYELIIPPADYPGKRYRGRYAYEHHVVYWLHTGKLVGDDEEIHHKDGNKRHNVFENFEVKSKPAHARYHAPKERLMAEFKCPACEKVFIHTKRNTCLTSGRGEVTCCSKKCTGAWTKVKQNKELAQKRIQENFVREFLQSKNTPE